MIVDLPVRFNRDTMYVLLQKVITKDRTPIANEITLDFSTLTKFIEPSGVTILSNIIHWLEDNSVDVNIQPGEINSYESPNKFLDDSLFFYQHLGEMINENAKVRNTTFPLEQVNAKKPMSWLINEFTPWLAKQLNVEANRLSTIQVCLEEILNNIKDHADKSTGCIFAQYMPNNHEILVSISDFGVGIPYNIQQKIPSLNDHEAIKKAIERGYSTQSKPHNRGYGLDNLIHNVVVNGQGKVHIHSLNGMLSCKHGDNGVIIKAKSSYGYYPGTLIELVFRTDVDEIFDIEEEEFSWEEW